MAGSQNEGKTGRFIGMVLAIRGAMTTLPSITSSPGVTGGPPRRWAGRQEILRPSLMEEVFEHELRRFPLREELPQFESPVPTPGNPPPTRLTKVEDSDTGLSAPVTEETNHRTTLAPPGEKESGKTTAEDSEPKAGGQTDQGKGESGAPVHSASAEKTVPENQQSTVQVQAEKGEPGTTGDKTSKPKMGIEEWTTRGKGSDSLQLETKPSDAESLEIPGQPEQESSPSPNESSDGLAGLKGAEESPVEKSASGSLGRNSDSKETSTPSESTEVEKTPASEISSSAENEEEPAEGHDPTSGGESQQPFDGKPPSHHTRAGQDKMAAFAAAGASALRVADRSANQLSGAVQGVSPANQPVLEKPLTALKEVFSGARSTVINQIAARLSALNTGGTVTVSLEPAELGKVLIRFIRKGEGWDVQLIPERPEIAGILAAELPRLEALLAKMHDPVRVDVSVGGDGQNSGQGTAETPNRASSPAWASEPATHSVAEISAPGTSTEVLLDAGHLDILT